MTYPSRFQRRKGASYRDKKAHRIPWAIRKKKTIAEIIDKKIKK